MPFPLAHPVAVLPFRRWCPRKFSLVGLIIGSVTPDAGYTLRHLDFDYFTHSALGSLVFCLPVGWIATLIVFALREPLTGTLPNPHREALLPLCHHHWPRPRIVALSVFIGTWTHILFDRLTHESAARGFGADSFHDVASSMQGKWYYQVLWIWISGISLLILAAAYLRFLRRATGSFRLLDLSDRRRIGLWLAVFLGPLLVIAPFSLNFFGARGPVFTKHAFYSILQPYLLSLMAAMFFLALIAYRRRRNSPSEPPATPPSARSSSDTPAPPG